MTGIVTCYNERATIEACLASLAWCDERIVVDSYSDDGTAEIVRSMPGVRFFQREYFGAGAAKNWALDHARSDWVVILDADEVMSDALRDEVLAILGDGPGHHAYTFRRRAYFLDRPIRFSGWQRDRVVRLFERGTALYENRRVHAVLETTGPAPQLRHRLDHYMVKSVEDYTRRMTTYGVWGAAQCWRDGRRTTGVEALSRAGWRFVRAWVLRLGFLDGVHGVLFCALQSHATFVKWATLWGWQVDAARGIEPALPEFDDDPDRWRIDADGDTVSDGTRRRDPGSATRTTP